MTCFVTNYYLTTAFYCLFLFLNRVQRYAPNNSNSGYVSIITQKSAAIGVFVAADLFVMPYKGRIFLRKIIILFAAISAANGHKWDEWLWRRRRYNRPRGPYPHICIKTLF